MQKHLTLYINMQIPISVPLSALHTCHQYYWTYNNILNYQDIEIVNTDICEYLEVLIGVNKSKWLW